MNVAGLSQFGSAPVARKATEYPSHSENAAPAEGQTVDQRLEGGQPTGKIARAPAAAGQKKSTFARILDDKQQAAETPRSFAPVPEESSLPVEPAGVVDPDELDVGELDEGALLLGLLEVELLLELGVLLPFTAVLTVSDELAGQPRRSSCASCAFASFSAVSSVLTVACAESRVEALEGFAVLFAFASAASSCETFVSSDCTVDCCWATVEADVPLGNATV